MPPGWFWFHVPSMPFGSKKREHLKVVCPPTSCRERRIAISSEGDDHVSAVRKRIDARVVDQFPEDVLGGALPREFPTDLHLAQAQVIDCGDHDQPVGVGAVQTLPERALCYWAGHLKEDPGMRLPFSS